jgi:hypothetical protein
MAIIHNANTKILIQNSPVDTAFDKDKSELRVLVLLVALKVLSNGDSLLNKHIKILRDLRGKTWAR